MQSFIPREAPEFGFNKIPSIWTNWEFLIIYEGSVASHSNMTHTSHDWYILVIDFVGGRMFQAPCYLKIYCVRAQECSVQVDENIVSWKGQDQVHCCKQGPLLFQSIFANTLVFGVSFSPSQSPFLVLYVPVRGVYFSKNLYFCTNPKNGPAQESRNALFPGSNISARI